MKDKKRILIIDDEEAVRTSFQLYLEDCGFQALTAEDGKEGIRLFEEERPHCVLVDLRMPHADGHQVIRHISCRDELVPVIVISGTEIMEDAVRSLREGAWDFMTKPVVDLATLLHRVEEVLKRAELIQQNRLYREELEDLVRQRTAELEKTNRALSRAIYNTVVILTQTIEAKDPYTRGHSLRVSEYSTALGKAMGLDDNGLQKLRLGSLLHDIGKIGISSQVLNKPDSLTASEYEKIKEHAEIGERILQNVDFFKPILPLIRNHHVWHDGNGYPLYQGDPESSLEAGILSVADVFDALTSDRPYRDAMTVEEALEVMEDIAGTQLCPELVRTFIDERIYDIDHDTMELNDLKLMMEAVRHEG